MSFRVGVIIPCYNAAHTLRRAVLSALDADVIMIVNDNSTDDIVRTMQHKLLKEHPDKVRYIRTGGAFPAGVCHARNLGIHHAQVDLIIPLDADDALVPGGITALRDAWQPDRVVYSSWREVDIGGAFIRDVTAPPPSMINRKNITQATVCYSKAQWEMVGGYDVDFNLGAEDWALMCAFASKGLHLHRIAEVTYKYTVNDKGRAARCFHRAPAIRALLAEKYPMLFP